MNLKEDLDVTLITFNRKDCLKNTLDKVFAKDSPINQCNLTIYDNHSDDGTKELCEEYATKYPNLKYVRNRRNIGLSGNICKAMENAAKKYLWILCDNDELHWQHWPEVQKGLDEDHDIVLASTFYLKDKPTEAAKLAQLTFLPSGIYKTDLITDYLMAWAVNDSYTVLPHVVMGCSVINDGKSIYAPKESVCMMTFNPEVKKSKDGETLDRVKGGKQKHLKANALAFEACILNATSSLQSNKIRMQFIQTLASKKKLNGWGPFFSLSRAIKLYMQGKITFSNVADVYSLLSPAQRSKFLLHTARMPLSIGYQKTFGKWIRSAKKSIKKQMAGASKGK